MKSNYILLKFKKFLNFKRKDDISLKKQLYIFITILIITVFFSISLLFIIIDINSNSYSEAQIYFSSELDTITNDIITDCNKMAVKSIKLSQELTEIMRLFLITNNIKEKDLENNPVLLENLLRKDMSSLISTLENSECSGVFVMLNITVNTKISTSKNSKAGVFLKKTEPNTISQINPDIHYLRGPATIAREYGIELLGQWRQEFDTTNQEYWKQIIDTTNNNPDLKLSQLYFWTNRVLLKDNSESGMLICVPLRDKLGNIYGICGMELSTMLFKGEYSPKIDKYQNVFTSLTSYNNTFVNFNNGLIAGNSYLTERFSEENVSIKKYKYDFNEYIGENISFYGTHKILTLYPKNSPYQNKKSIVTLMIPKDNLKEKIPNNSNFIIISLSILFIFSLLFSIVICNKYIKPLKIALEQIKTKEFINTTKNKYTEINDLMEYLIIQDKVAKESNASSSKDINESTTYKQLSIPMVEEFKKNILSLSKAEKAVFDLYLEGHTAKEITEILFISINTVKTHNRHIFAKLNVANRNELMAYINMLQEIESASIDSFK